MGGGHGLQSTDYRVQITENFASKREQNQTCLNYAEREQSQDRRAGLTDYRLQSADYRVQITECRVQSAEYRLQSA